MGMRGFFGVAAVLVMVVGGLGADPQLLGKLDIKGAKAVAYYKGDVILMAGEGWVKLVDVRDEGKPKVLGEMGMTGTAYAAVVVGDVAYVQRNVAGASSELMILKLSASGSIGLHGEIPYSYGFSVNNGLLYTAHKKDTASRELTIYDISDPLNPVAYPKANRVETRSLVLMDVEVRGSYAFCANGDRGGLVVLDVSDPADQKVVAVHKFGFMFSTGVLVSQDGKVAYVADYGNGFVRFDVSDPTNPVVKGKVGTYIYEITLTDNKDFAVAASFSTGIVIIDLRDPDTLSIVASAPLPYDPIRAIGVSVHKDRAYAVNLDEGLVVFDLSEWIKVPPYCAGVSVNGQAADPIPVNGPHLTIGGTELANLHPHLHGHQAFAPPTPSASSVTLTCCSAHVPCQFFIPIYACPGCPVASQRSGNLPSLLLANDFTATRTCSPTLLHAGSRFPMTTFETILMPGQSVTLAKTTHDAQNIVFFARPAPDTPAPWCTKAPFKGPSHPSHTSCCMA